MTSLVEEVAQIICCCVEAYDGDLNIRAEPAAREIIPLIEKRLIEEMMKVTDPRNPDLLLEDDGSFWVDAQAFIKSFAASRGLKVEG